MKQYKLKLTLRSPAVTASGEGYGAIVDADVIYDELGIPFIPAKRIKGCLRDAARDIGDMLSMAGIPFQPDIEDVFGKPGSAGSAPVYFSDLVVENCEETRKWLRYYMTNEKFAGIVSREQVLNAFTRIRQQTAIGPEGVAHEHSLRTCRAVRKGTVFFGDVFLEEHGGTSDVARLDMLILACAAFRRMGTSRNRGFGEVECILVDGDAELGIPKKLEELCIK